MSENLYEEVLDYVENHTSFYEKEVPEVDIETSCFVSHKKQRALKVQLDELEELSIEYGMGLQGCETESGVRYMRMIKCKDTKTVSSLEDVAEFLA